MDPAIGDLVGDVEIRDGRITGVGPELRADGAQVVDGRGRVLLPGFVDTHWHLWGTLLRGVIGDGPANGWFARKGRLGHHLAPEDTAAGVRIALAEGLAAGITTVHDWAHNVLSPADADANLAVHVALGARVRFSYGAPSTTPGMSIEEMARFMSEMGFLGPDRAMDMGDVLRIRQRWVSDGDGLISIGVALRGPSRSTTDVYRQEWAVARANGLPIAMHCAGTRAEVAKIRQVEVLDADGLLGPDLL
ncbi:MAG: amidohydrolase family protein, partial [Candidatus Limnocylindrales bacterium]